MGLRSACLWLLFGVSMVTTPGCFCCRPWHRCGYYNPDDAAATAPLVVPADVPAEIAVPPNAAPVR